MAIEVDEITTVFIEESLEGLDVMEQGLLNLDIGAADSEVMNQIFRAAHSIKGGGATFGFLNVSEFAHELETLLDQMRQGDRAVTTVAVDLMLQSVDCLRGLIAGLSDEDSTAATQAAHLKQALQRMVADETDSVPATLSDTAATRIRVTPQPAMLMQGVDPLAILAALQSLGDATITCLGTGDLQLAELDPTACHLAWLVAYDGTISEAALSEVLDDFSDYCDFQLEAKPDADATANVPTSPAKPSNSGSNVTESSSIRVNIDKVDDLINLVG
ncbi:MAG: Hpt domain-containing protein, partial [Pseudomonadota bacterium]